MFCGLHGRIWPTQVLRVTCLEICLSFCAALSEKAIFSNRNSHITLHILVQDPYFHSVWVLALA